MGVRLGAAFVGLALVGVLLLGAVSTFAQAPEAEQRQPPAKPTVPAQEEPSSESLAASEPIDYVVEDGSVLAVAGTERTTLAIAGPAVAVLRSGSQLFVAGGSVGVAVYDVTEPLAPRLVREIPLGGAKATGFHLADDQVWVVVLSKTAIPLAGAPAVDAEAAPTPADSPRKPAPVAKRSPAPERRAEPPLVVPLRVVSPGIVELAVGTGQGVRVGHRFAILRSVPVEGGPGAGFEGEKLVAVAEVVATKPGTCLAEVGRGAVVKSGDRARRATRDEKEDNGFPPRVPGIGEASVTLRPLINIGTPLGVGVLADLGLSYWGGAYFANVSLKPLGLGFTSDGKVITTAALAESGYDGRAFSVGLGVGVSWINGDTDSMLDGSDYATSRLDEPTREERQKTHSAFTVSQLARLGARDGLHLAVRNLLLLHEDQDTDEYGFIYGGTSGRVVIPTGRHTDLYFEAGGGVMGYWFFGLGVATWVVGNGSPGSWRLAVSAGGAGIHGSREVTESYGDPPTTTTYDEDIDVAGPMVSLGVSHRFMP